MPTILVIISALDHVPVTFFIFDQNQKKITEGGSDFYVQKA
jgi:hypothetical protein